MEALTYLTYFTAYIGRAYLLQQEISNEFLAYVSAISPNILIWSCFDGGPILNYKIILFILLVLRDLFTIAFHQ